MDILDSSHFLTPCRRAIPLNAHTLPGVLSNRILSGERYNGAFVYIPIDDNKSYHCIRLFSSLWKGVSRLLIMEIAVCAEGQWEITSGDSPRASRLVWI